MEWIPKAVEKRMLKSYWEAAIIMVNGLSEIMKKHLSCFQKPQEKGMQPVKHG